MCANTFRSILRLTLPFATAALAVAVSVVLRHLHVPFLLLLVVLMLTAVTTGRSMTDIEFDSREVTRKRGRFDGRRALVVGAGTLGRTLAESLERERDYYVVGFVDDELAMPIGGRWHVLGRRHEIAGLVKTHLIDEIFVAHAPTWQQSLAEYLTHHHPEVSLHVVPSPYEALMQTSDVSSLGDIALVSLGMRKRWYGLTVKRVLDFISAVIGLLLLAPICLATVIAVKLTSPGPALFKQERVGLRGKRFMMYKFRTMVVDAESTTGPVRSIGSRDDRLTTIGRIIRKFRIDEIPQLVNVLVGEMSLVGPRPERPCFTDQYEQQVPTYARRHDVPPGITGLAQVRGGYHTDARDKLRFDLHYVSHQSFGLDLWILIQTVKTVCMPRAREFERPATEFEQVGK